MTERTLSYTTIGAGAGLLVCCLAFVFLLYDGVSLNGLMVPVTLGWILALAASRSLVEREKHAALYFAFAVLALMIFFIHETYGYTGKVRNFPLIVGYTGVVLSVFDVLSLTGTRAGTWVTRLFSGQIETRHMEGRPVRRELIAFAAMGGCVLGIWLFGFLVFSPIFVTLWMLVGGKPLRASLYGGVFTLLFVYLLFEVAFRYELYRGALFIWLFDL